MDPIDLAQLPQPEWNAADSVPSALAALRAAHDEASAKEAYDQFLWSVGDTHAGTFHPVVLAALPQLDELLATGGIWTQYAVIEALIDLGGSFVPAEGHATHRGVDVQEWLQMFIHALRPRLAALAERDDVLSNGARELVDLIDDQTPVRPVSRTLS